MEASLLADRIEVLARLPLFDAFSRVELESIADGFEEVAYRRGATICAQGEEAESFYVCLSGELEVWGGSPKRVINRLRPGDWFGEVALLLGGPRAATVTAARAARLLVLDKSVFDRVFLRNPKMLEHVSRVLCRRLAGLTRGEAVTKATTIVAVTATAGLRGKTLVAAALGRLLHRFTGGDAVVVTLTPARDGEAPPMLAQLAGASVDAVRKHLVQGALPQLAVGLPDRSAPELADGLAALATRLGDAFPWVVVDGGGGPGPIAAAATESADVLVRIVDRFDPPSAPRTENGLPVFHVVNLYNPSSPAVPISHCEPFVLRADPALRGLGPAECTEYLVTRPRSPAGASLHRLARKILGGTVGVVLGGGAAFGIAHVGVLKVLEEHDIPIDMLVGCSMGSLVAVGYAGGLRAADMVDIAARMGTVWNTLSLLRDVTLTRPGLLTGDRVVELLLSLAEPMESFDDLLLPCRVVATDIETGERVSIGSGSFEAAGRASCAIPMIVSPVQRDGRILVDGGVCDPVPAEVLTEMGADITIAVNAVPRLQKGVQTVLSRWFRRIRRLDPISRLAGSKDLPNMFDLIMNAMQTLQHELGQFKAISADVRITPDLAALTWIEFYNPQPFIDRGVEAAERAIPAIKRVLAERGLGPRAPAGRNGGAAAELGR
jgi:NTE family protein